MNSLEVLIVAELVSKEDYVPVQPDSARCVDDRGGKEGVNLGPQLPGGSEHIADLLFVAIKKTGKDINDQTLMELTHKIYQTETAQQHNLLPGVHIDDAHGELDMEECEYRDEGCGYDKVRAQVLAKMGIVVEHTPGTLIRQARQLGWGVQVLSHGHDPLATAAQNDNEGLTLDTNALHAKGKTPSFNHDRWVVKVLLPEMMRVLEEKGFGEAVELLQAQALEWSSEIYGNTLSILTEDRLNSTTITQFYDLDRLK